MSDNTWMASARIVKQAQDKVRREYAFLNVDRKRVTIVEEDVLIMLNAEMIAARERILELMGTTPA